MPGNEAGDRVHNFFDQGNLSQNQRRTEFVEANWPGFHNNVFSANERQLGGPLNASSKNYGGQHSEIERGQNNSFSLASHGLNVTQSSLRPEYVKSPLQVQQPNLNGFVHTPQAFNARQNEANFLGVDRDSDRQNMTSRGMSILESQQKSMQQHSNSANFRGSDAPMNFNFLGGQQQMSSQQSGMFQPLPQQQSGISDTQLMQQQVMFKQMQELQRRQQLQQFEAMQRNAMNNMSAFQNQSAEQHLNTINGNSMKAASNYPWQSQVMAGGTNWQQHGHPSAVHAYSNGLVVNPEQGQAMRFMSSSPQQASQSLYGVPVSNSISANQFSQNSMDKPGVFHTPAASNTFSGSPFARQAEQAGMQYASTTSRSGSEGKPSLEHASNQGSEKAVKLGCFNQVQPMKVSMLDGGGRGLVGGSNVSREKSSMEAAASQSTSSQSAVGLDPTEEKILFGNDDNIWEAFGGASAPGNEGANLFNDFPSLQSGTWSALMQSAVAETSSSDVGTQEEWSALDSQNSRSQSRTQQVPISQDNEKPPPVWVDSSQRAVLGPRTANDDVGANNATLNTNNFHTPSVQQPFSNLSSPTESQVLQGRSWLDCNSPKPHTEEKRVLENANSSSNLSKIGTGFWSHEQSTFPPESVPDSTVNSSVQSGGFGLRNVNSSHESSQRPPGNHSLDLWRQVNFASKSGIVSSGNDQHNMNNGQSVVNSSLNTPVGRVAEMHRIENNAKRETSVDNRQSSFPNHGSPGCSKENVWSEAGRRVPAAHNFQYHATGGVDVDESSSAKEGLHSHSMPHSSGLKVHESQPPLPRSAGSSLSDMEKGQVSGFHGGATMFHEGSSSGVHPGYIPSMSAPFARSGENSSPNQHFPPSQNMLELLHKVDQSTDQNAISNLGSSSTSNNRSSDIPSGGHVRPGQSQSSSSQGFNLQLAPPSQGIASSNLNDPSQSFLRNVGSPSPLIVSSEIRHDSQSRWASEPSTQCVPPSHRPPQNDFGNDISGGLDGSLSNVKANLYASFAPNSVNPRNPFQNQQMAAARGQMMDDHQSSSVSSDRHANQDQRSIVNQNQSGMRNSIHQTPSSLRAVMSGMMKDNMSLGGHYLGTSQQQLGAQGHGSSGFMNSHFQSSESLDINSFSQQKKDERDVPRSSDAISSPGVRAGEDRTVADPRLSGKTSGVSQEESVGRQSMEVSPSNSAASQKDADVSHNSLKPSSMAQQSYSSLHQMQAMKTMGMDPSHRESKRFRGPESSPGVTQMVGKAVEPPFTGGMNSMVKDPSVSQGSVSSGDSKMLNFSPQSGSSFISRLPHGAVAPQDTLSFSRSDPQTFFTGNGTNRPQLTGISPQMAPTWFEQYRTLRSGQLLPVHNLPGVPIVNNMQQQQQQLQLTKPPSSLAVHDSAQMDGAGIDTCQIANSSQITNMYDASEHMSSLHALVPHVPSSIPVSMRPKKRKTATSDLIPWNKEIGQCYKRIPNIRSAEIDWAQSSNRLVEKGGDETDSHEYVSPVVRPRRRLILTTKLMQQVFCPPSASILSLDGRANYEAIMYSIARLALGDSCNLICGMENDLSTDTENTPSGKAKTSERICDQYVSKVMEEFTNRAKELENELLRLDKRASILDFRLDCQDLERFSVINRFARFHVRSQVDGAETSSSADANAVPQKSCPQRYVTAHPMPRTVPETVPCLTIN